MNTWQLVDQDRDVLLAVARCRGARTAYTSLQEIMSDMEPGQFGEIGNDLEGFRREEHAALETLGDRLPETWLGLHALLVLARELLGSEKEKFQYELDLLQRVVNMCDSFVRNQIKKETRGNTGLEDESAPI